MPWYRKRPGEIRKWIDLACWINGETGGYLRVCTEGRNWFKTDFPNWLKAEDKPIGPDDRSARARQLHHRGPGDRAGATAGTSTCVNDGCITNLPEDCIVEVPGYVDRNGDQHPDRRRAAAGAAPPRCRPASNVQRMAVEAAVDGDATLLKQAMLHDPLTAAVCDPEEIWQMVDEMLVAQAKWLPQYAREIPAARKRLAAAKRSGRYQGTHKWQGAARARTRTVAEMRAKEIADAKKKIEVPTNA